MGRVLKPVITPLLFALTTGFMSSCGSDDEPPTAESRTILVYMVAANNLGYSGYDQLDLDEMREAAATAGFNGGRLLVYYAPDGDNSRQSMFEITADGETTLATYSSDRRSTDVERMSQVIDDMCRFAPATGYGLILWSHATGWVGEPKTSDVRRSYGLDSGHVMSIPSLASALSGHKFDFIYADCCYMGGIEVVYELRNSCHYFIASAAEVPSEGMPYQLTLPKLFAKNADYADVAQTTFRYYSSKNKAFDRTCTISVTDCDAIGHLAEVTRRIYATANPVPDNFTPQRFMLGSRCYYFDWAQYVEAIAADASLKAEWDKALSETVIMEAHTEKLWNTLPILYHCGLSTYIIDTDETFDSYDDLAWWKHVANSLQH